MDLDEGILASRRAVAAARPDSHDHAALLSNLGYALRTRFTLTGVPADLAEAIQVGRQAVDQTPTSMPDRTSYLANLARTLDEAYRSSGDRSYLDRALAHLPEAIASSGAPALQRMEAARLYGDLAAAADRTTEAADCYASAVRILPLAAWHGLDRAAQENRLSLFHTSAADAAAWQMTAARPAAAIELLEIGRSVLWQHALDTRPDLDRVRAVDPVLAERLVTLARRRR